MDGYLRIVNEQDVFARVPQSRGFGYPTACWKHLYRPQSTRASGRFRTEHAGDCVWYRDDGRILFREEPKGVSLRTVQSGVDRVGPCKVRETVRRRTNEKEFPESCLFSSREARSENHMHKLPRSKERFPKKRTKKRVGGEYEYY